MAVSICEKLLYLMRLWHGFATLAACFYDTWNTIIPQLRNSMCIQNLLPPKGKSNPIFHFSIRSISHVTSLTVQGFHIVWFGN